LSHEPATHTVPTGHFSHIPSTVHFPVFPHPLALGGAPLHRASITPAPIGWQLPSSPATLQRLQGSHESALQHTPSVHLALAHSVPAEHIAPSGFGPQLALLQTFGVLHSAEPAVQLL